MKSGHIVLLLICLMAKTSAACAIDFNVNATDKNVMPVFVQVNNTGVVTQIMPATKLSPKLDRALGDTIRHWVTGPAMDKNNKPIASQIIMRVSLSTNPNGKGQLDANFKLVSMESISIASSNVHWQWNGSQLVLSSGTGGNDSLGTSSSIRVPTDRLTYTSEATMHPYAIH